MQFPLSLELLHRLPRHPDWRYELVDGEAWLSPRPRPLGFVRSTAVPVPTAPTPGVEVRTVRTARDRAGVAALLVDLWSEEDPYRSFADDVRNAELQREVERAVIAPDALEGAVCLDARGLCACVLVTGSSPPALSWLSVHRDVRGRGLASAMLDIVLGAMARRGVRAVASYASAANVPSLRWHLARGFELTPDPLWELRSR